MIPKLLTIEDITQMLGIGRGTAYKIAKAIKHTKVGRRILVEEQILLDYIRNPAAINHSPDSSDTRVDS